MMRQSAPLALLLLAGCGGPAPSTTGNAAATAAESGYIARVQALTPRQREGVLFRAIQNGGGQACQGVDKVEALAPTKGRPNWRVTCPGDSQWLVTLSDDGTAIVTGARSQ